MRCLHRLGGAHTFVRTAMKQQKAWAGVDAAADPAKQEQVQVQLVHILEYMLTPDGVDFHSDFELIPPRSARPDEEDKLQGGGAAPAAAAAAAEQWDSDASDGDEPLDRHTVVLTHSFRTQTATGMLHALDRGDYARLPHISREGAPLSARKARQLEQRSDLRLLYDADRVRLAITTDSSHTKKRKKRPGQLNSNDDATQSDSDGEAVDRRVSGAGKREGRGRIHAYGED